MATLLGTYLCISAAMGTFESRATEIQIVLSRLNSFLLRFYTKQSSLSPEKKIWCPVEPEHVCGGIEWLLYIGQQWSLVYFDLLQLLNDFYIIVTSKNVLLYSHPIV